MTAPSEITPLLAQAWEKDPDQHFFEFLFTVFQTNGTLFAMGDITHDQIKEAFTQYLEGASDDATVENDGTPDAGDSAGDTPSTA